MAGRRKPPPAEDPQRDLTAAAWAINAQLATIAAHLGTLGTIAAKHPDFLRGILQALHGYTTRTSFRLGRKMSKSTMASLERAGFITFTRQGGAGGWTPLPALHKAIQELLKESNHDTHQPPEKT
jgi:hypothetical protein